MRVRRSGERMEWRSPFGGEVPLEGVRATIRNRERMSQSVKKNKRRNGEWGWLQGRRGDQEDKRIGRKSGSKQRSQKGRMGVCLRMKVIVREENKREGVWVYGGGQREMREREREREREGS
jgi:hypothetical protein